MINYGYQWLIAMAQYGSYLWLYNRMMMIDSWLLIVLGAKNQLNQHGRKDHYNYGQYGLVWSYL